MRTTLLCLFVLAAPPLSVAANSARYLDYRDYMLRGTPEAAVIADVNNDGLPDAVVATFAGTAVLLGRGDGTLRAPINVGAAGELSLAVADFNNDGNPDIAATILTNGTQITLALGKGNGGFQRPQTLPIGCIDCYLAAADFNGDGNMDLAVASNSSVTVYLGDGHGGFTGGLPAYFTSFTTAVATGDINKDGHPDLVVSDFGAGTVVVLLGKGDGSFQRTDYPAGSQPYQPVLADFNGDGLPDLASPDRASNTVLVRLNQGGGAFGASVSFPAACSPFGPQVCTLEGLASGDFNHDGKIDLATPGGILLGNGDGTFQSANAFYSGSVPLTVASGDLNGDGFSDLLVCDSGSLDISVLLGAPHPTQRPVHVAAGSHPKAVATGDFNGDGKADMAVAAYGDNVVHVFLGRGDGTFTTAPDLPVREPGAVLALDLNGDGKTDLAVSGGSGTYIYLGTGNGTFTAGATYGSLFGDCTPNAFSSTAAPCLVAADFNGDHIPDLAGGLWINGTVSLLLGNGDGTFRAGAETLHTSDTPQGLAVGDFNHDGRTDLAVSGYFGSVYVFPGQGNGAFGSPVILRVGQTAVGLAAGDINGDGNLDLVVAGGSGSSTISLSVFVITGNGDLTFNPPVPLLADEAPNGVLLGDFNGDGLLDIASANLLADNISVHINQGGLSFAPALLYGAGGGPVALAKADLNGDHHLDILAVNQYSGDVSVLLHAPK